MQVLLDKANEVGLNINKGDIQVKTHDGEFDAKTDGRVQVDAACYDEDGTEMGNGTEIRRARLYIQGKMLSVIMVLILILTVVCRSGLLFNWGNT